MSEGFRVTNGVRQGGILSPYLFCIYMDELSDRLNAVTTGCIMGQAKMNHQMYADDRVLVSPATAHGLYKLIAVCEQSNYKYMGHIICDDLKDEMDISRQCKKVYAQGNSVIRKFRMCTEK